MTHNKEHELSGRINKVTEEKPVTLLPVASSAKVSAEMNHLRVSQIILAHYCHTWFIYTHTQYTAGIDHMSARNIGCCGGVALRINPSWLHGYDCGF